MEECFCGFHHFIYHNYTEESTLQKHTKQTTYDFVGFFIFSQALWGYFKWWPMSMYCTRSNAWFATVPCETWCSTWWMRQTRQVVPLSAIEVGTDLMARCPYYWCAIDTTRHHYTQFFYQELGDERFGLCSPHWCCRIPFWKYWCEQLFLILLQTVCFTV